MTCREMDNICKNIILLKKDNKNLTNIIDKDYILNCLKNKDENYYILYYTILYKEDAIKEILDLVILEILFNFDNEFIIDILKYAPFITDFTAIEMMEKININEFDYRYYILKRREISDFIKENMFDSMTCKELDEYINQIEIKEDTEYVKEELEKIKEKKCLKI